MEYVIYYHITNCIGFCVDVMFDFISFYDSSCLYSTS